MKLSTLLGRLGADELARRLGVKPATVKRWGKVGVPKKRRDDYDKVVRRHLAAKKAAAHRKAQKEAEFRDLLPRPPKPEDHRYPIQDPEDTLPDAPPPPSAREEGSRGDDQYEYEEHREVENQTRFGDVFSYNIDKPAADVDPDDIVELALKHWIESGRLWCYVKLFCLRYIPFNPLYKGALRRKQGKWHDWWSSTPVRSTEKSIAQAIHNLFTGFRNRRGGRSTGIHEAAESRMIWLLQVQIYCLDDREKIDLDK